MQEPGKPLFVEATVPFDDAADARVLEANLRALEARDRGLAERVRAASTEGLVFFRSKAGAWSARDGSVYVVSKYDPEGELRPRVREIVADPPEVVLALGVGLGYHLCELSAAFDGVIVLYEPDDRLLKAAFAVTDLSAFLARRRLAVADSLLEINFNAQGYFPHKVRLRYEQFPLPSYKRRAPEEQGRFLERMRLLQRDADVQAETVLVKGRTWFRYLIENLPETHRLPDIGALRGAFRDTPVVIVASGPSLSRNLPVLRQAKGRACIFCVGTALRKLVSAGVVPDAVFGIESNDILYQFEGIPELGAMVLMTLLKSYPPLFALPARRKFVFGDVDREQVWAMKAMGRKDGLVRVGGSVATAAFSVAHALGAPAIVLVGQDLALGDGGISHAEGTGTGAENFADEVVLDPARRSDLNAKGLELVEGYDGGLVATRFHWLSYLLWFEFQAKSLAGAGPRLINATEGGARIHGMEQMSLARVIDEVLPVSLPEDPVARMDRLAASCRLPPADTLIRSLETDLRQLRLLRRVGARSTSRIRETFELLRSASVDAQTVNRRLELIRKVEKRLLDAVRKVDSVLAPLTRSEVLIARNCFDDPTDRLVALRNNLNQSHLLHDGVRAAAEDLVPLFESVLDRIAETEEDVKLSTTAAWNGAEGEVGESLSGAG